MTATNIFESVSDISGEHDIQWKNLCGLCTDTATSMFGCRLQIQVLTKTVAPNATGTHCVIYWEMLAARTLPSGLNRSAPSFKQQIL
jgi:hypothetical protein